jgi:hypothetical protein
MDDLYLLLIKHQNNLKRVMEPDKRIKYDASRIIELINRNI